MAFKRSDFNYLIGLVNAKIDSGCANVTRLVEVAENHIWSVQDIVTVRNKLTEMCQATFSVPLRTWSQSILTEIVDQLEKCSCGSCGYTDLEPISTGYGGGASTGETSPYLTWTSESYQVTAIVPITAALYLSISGQGQPPMRYRRTVKSPWCEVEGWSVVFSTSRLQAGSTYSRSFTYLEKTLTPFEYVWNSQTLAYEKVWGEATQEFLFAGASLSSPWDGSFRAYY